MSLGGWRSGETQDVRRTHSGLIFCVDDERENGRLCPHGTRDRIDDEQTAKPAPPKSTVDGEAADEACRKGRITRQPLGLFGRQFREGKAGGSEGVVTGNLPGGIKRYKAIADAAANILCCQLAKISVEGRHPARKASPIMGGTQRFKGESLAHCDGVVWRR
jgi:hypothetical protein